MTALLALLLGCGVGPLDLPDPSEDTSDDVDPIDPALSGTIGLIEYTRLQVACPECFGTSSDLLIEASAAFHAERQGSWLAWMPAIGGCTTATDPVPLTTADRDLGAWIYLQSGSRSVSLARTPGALGTVYSATGLRESDYVSNAAWDLVAPDGPLNVQGALHTAEGFSAIQPEAMLFVHPDVAFAADIFRQGHTFTWAPVGSGDFFAVLIDAYHPTSGDYLGSVLCRGFDSGSLTVPGASLAAFPGYALLGIGLYRYRYAVGDVGDGTSIEGVTSTGVLGTGTLIP